MTRARVLMMYPVAIALVGFNLSRADESIVPEPASAELPGEFDRQVAGWLKALRSDDFEARTEATKRLLELGKSGIGIVERAAETGDLETSSRCLDILKRLKNGTDPNVRFEAEKALERLTKSENRSVAQRAVAITWKPDPNLARNRLGGVRLVAGPAIPPAPAVIQRKFQREATVEEEGKKLELREILGKEVVVKVTETVEGKPRTTTYSATNAAELLAKHRNAYELYAKHLRGKAWKEVADPNVVPAGVRIAVAGGGIGGGRLRIQTRITNGNRSIDVDENGKRISIQDEMGKNITIKVTETEGGKETTREYKAADVDELKKKHPAGAEVYEKYGGAANGIRINGGGIRIEQQAIPGAAIPAQALPIR